MAYDWFVLVLFVLGIENLIYFYSYFFEEIYFDNDWKEEYYSFKETFSSQRPTSFGELFLEVLEGEFSFLKDDYYVFCIFVGYYDEFWVFILSLFDLLRVLFEVDRPL